ncbi:MAG: hypothetical protein J3R72DRAFT_493704 [Linnemannia gamsii]|nr:MAG: hypothetical protein J3R72DRAFT_493704 [Linnemannia gamsii]
MHFSTIIASASILVLAASVATVSAHEVTKDCDHCLTEAALAASPTCTIAILYSKTTPSAKSPAEKACLCPLVSNFGWFQSCSSVCTANEISEFTQYYMHGEAVLCNGASTSSPAPGATTSTAPGATASTAPGTTTPSAPGTKPSSGPGTTTSSGPGTKPSSPPAAPGVSATPGAVTGTGTPSTPETPKSDAVALFGSSSKALVGAALGIASAIALLL